MPNQSNRSQNARPYLRAIARAKTIDAGFLLGVQLPDAKTQLIAQDSVALDTLLDASVRDMRDLAWLSIDEQTSRDLDQISVAEALDDGATRLSVAIADVDAWIPQGSPLDRHAAGNATSVFTGVANYPMLPEQLALGRASLVEGEDRLAVVVELIVEPEGAVRSVDAHRALVRNQARLSYTEAGAWLEDETSALPASVDATTIGNQLRLHEQAILALRGRRLATGALDMVRSEVLPIFDDDRIIDMLVVPPNRARTMIEHLMVTVNSAIARYMSGSGLPWLARIQSPRNWDAVLDLADEHEYDLPDDPDRVAFGGFIHHLRTADPDDFARLQPEIARMLGATEDMVMQPDEEPLPHYSLAIDGYTRATAPIRRYADLLAQRLLKAAIAGQPAPYSVPELDELVEHARKRSRAAETIEREMFKIYGILMVQDRTSEVFDATVTNANDYGVWARIDHPPVEGRLMRADASMMRGDRIQVRITRTNWERGFVDLTLIP